MNLNLYLHRHRMLMVDCGSMFQDPDERCFPKSDEIIVPDTQFVEEHRGSLEALILTHAHEDHIGAIVPLWKRFPTRIYATPFTAEVLRRKLARASDDAMAALSFIEEVEVERWYQIGPFMVRWVPMTHSTLESNGLEIHMSSFRAFHTGDWKFDRSPVLGPAVNKSKNLRFEKTRFDAVICDSTNALKSGHSISEQEVFEGLYEVMAAQPNRVFVTCFASNVARLVSIARATKRCGRYLAVLGRSFENMIAIARKLGYWPDDLKIYSPAEAAYLPKNEMVFLVTGSQGEPRASLNRLTKGAFRGVEMESDDTVIFSSMRIPGNEVEIARLMANLEARGLRVIEQANSSVPIHASGHPNKEELEDLYKELKPKTVVPTHGFDEHLLANAEVAREAGVRRRLTGRNGDLFQLHPSVKLIRGFAPADRCVVKSGT